MFKILHLVTSSLLYTWKVFNLVLIDANNRLAEQLIHKVIRQLFVCKYVVHTHQFAEFLSPQLLFSF